MVLTTVTETKTTIVIETTTTTVTTVIESETIGENVHMVKKPAWNIMPTKAVLVEAGAKLVLEDKLWPSLSDSANKSFTKISRPNSSNIDSTKEVDSSKDDSELEPLATEIDVSSTPISPLSSDEDHTSKDSTKHDGEDEKESSHQSSPVEESKSDDNHDSSKPNSSHSSQTPNGSGLPSQRNNRVRPYQQNSLRKPHSRGEASHQNHWGSRHGQGRGYNDWNHQMGFATPPYFYPPFVPYPVMTPMMLPVYLAPGMQCAPPPGPYYPPWPPMDYQLASKIRQQIEFYFSTENLVKDTFLRMQMNHFGWVSVDVISEFNKVKLLCKDLVNPKFQILRALRTSPVVQVFGIKIRRKDDWRRWVLPPFFQNPTPLLPQIAQALAPVQDQTEVVSQDEKTTDLNDQLDGSATASTSEASPTNSNNASMASVEEASPTECNNA